VLHDPDYDGTLFRGIDWSPAGQLLAVGGYDHGVYLWDLAAGVRRWVGQADPPSRIYRVAWSPDGEQVASCGEDGSICLWKATDGVLQERLWNQQEAMVGLAWSSDGAQLASCGGGRGGGAIVIWDVPEKRVHQMWRGLPGKVHAVAWNPRRRVVISGNSEGMICWWEAESAKCLAICKGHDGAVQALQVSPDGQTLASSGDDSAIRLWDIESAELLQTLRQDRPYERLDITGVRGLTMAQKDALITLGAVDSGPG
jgi:WD40 repeat protein